MQPSSYNFCFRNLKLKLNLSRNLTTPTHHSDLSSPNRSKNAWIKPTNILNPLRHQTITYNYHIFITLKMYLTLFVKLLILLTTLNYKLCSNILQKSLHIFNFPNGFCVFIVSLAALYFLHITFHITVFLHRVLNFLCLWFMHTFISMTSELQVYFLPVTAICPRLFWITGQVLFYCIMILR